MVAFFFVSVRYHPLFSRQTSRSSVNRYGSKIDMSCFLYLMLMMIMDLVLLKAYNGVKKKVRIILHG